MNNLIYKVLLVIVVVLLLVAGIFFIFFYSWSSSEILIETSSTPQSSASPSSFKTYQDPKGYFSIQFPADFTAFPMDFDDGSHGAEINMLNTPYVFTSIVSVKPNTNISSLKIHVDNLVMQYEKDAEQSAAGVSFETKPITVDGLDGFAIFSAESSAVANVDVNYYFLKNKILYNFNSGFSSYAPGHEKIIADMVASLRFLK